VGVGVVAHSDHFESMTAVIGRPQNPW
jgi:hypothetical protein